MRTLAFAGITVALFGCIEATIQDDAQKLKIHTDYVVPLSGDADNSKKKVEVKMNIEKMLVKNDILHVSGTVTETVTSKSNKTPVSNKNVDKHVSVDTCLFDVDIRGRSDKPGKYEWFAAGTPSNQMAKSSKFSEYHSDMGNALVNILDN